VRSNTLCSSQLSHVLLIGHEADYVIVSPTRTTSPGFLSVQSRTNVMLTRCKIGMIIVSSEFFTCSIAERTLLGKLAAHWDDLGPGDSTWISMSRLLNQAADLPGMPSRPSRMPISHPMHIPSPPTAVSNIPSTSQSSPQQPQLTGISSVFRTARVNPFAAYTRGVPHSSRTQASASWIRPSSRRIDDPDFPEIPNSDFLRQPILRGQWRHGSAPARQV
jgi:hypothetical protein